MFLLIFIFCARSRISTHEPVRGGSAPHQFVLAPFEMDSLRHEHRDLGLPIYPCAHLRIWSRETVPATLLRYRTWVYLQEVIIPRSRERGLILRKLSTNAVQAPHELPLDRNASRYTQCRVRKQSNECESEKRLVKSQRSGVALTERGGSWGFDGSCFAAIAAERPLCPHETISTTFFQPFASTGLYQFVRNFRSILEHVSFRSPSHFVRLHGKTHRLFFSGRSSNGTASIWTAFLYARSRT